MYLFQQLHRIVTDAILSLHPQLTGADSLRNVSVEPPRDASHGDVSTNAAMVLAKPLGMNPRALAEALVAKLKENTTFTSADIAGPGFINLRLKPELWLAAIPVMINEGNSYGNLAIGKGKKVNVEYVSANPTGPMHVGHARGAVFGDALSLLLLKAGYSVTKEYYVNDAGAQVNVLARSAYLRYREALGEKIGEIPQGLYPGEYLIGVGQALAEKYGRDLLGEDESAWLPEVKHFTIESMLALIKHDLADLGIVHDVFVSEQSLHDARRIPAAINVLQGKNLVYRGMLEPPKGKKPDDWEEREQLLFRSTNFGDDSDRPLQKSDGNYTYFAADLAYALDKIARGFDSLVYVLGADHGGYKKRMEAAVSALSDGKVDCDIKLCQLVHLYRDGEPLKMSKRAGRFETVRDVLEAVGRDVMRFIMLTRRNDQTLDFDLDKVKEQSKDNPVFYVQYAHARCKSLLRTANSEMPEAWEQSQKPDGELLAQLSTEAESAIIKRLVEWPRQVEQAALHHEPHRIAYYLQELAQQFHSLWNQGNGEADLRFLVPGNVKLTAARLALARAVAVVVASGLTTLGVEPVEELR